MTRVAASSAWDVHSNLARIGSGAGAYLVIRLLGPPGDTTANVHRGGKGDKVGMSGGDWKITWSCGKGKFVFISAVPREIISRIRHGIRPDLVTSALGLSLMTPSGPADQEWEMSRCQHLFWRRCHHQNLATNAFHGHRSIYGYQFVRRHVSTYTIRPQGVIAGLISIKKCSYSIVMAV